MTKTYNPSKVSISFGNHIVTGLADDSFITIEYAGDGTSYQAGADGEVVRSVDPTSIYTIKVSVQQTSDTNEFLLTQYEMDQQDGSGTFSVNISDLLGNERFVSATAWVTKPASFARGKTADNREWELVCGNGEFK